MFIPSIIARVRGILSVTVEPLSGVLSTETDPPIVSIFFTTTSIPTPRPENSVTFSFVEKPGRKIIL